MRSAVLLVLSLFVTACGDAGCGTPSRDEPAARPEPEPARQLVVQSCCGGCDDPGCESCRGALANEGCREDETPALCGDPADGTTCRSTDATEVPGEVGDGGG